jgi:hypothetical protein
MDSLPGWDDIDGGKSRMFGAAWIDASADTIGSSMLVVDAITERAAAFYEANGFLRLPDSLRLVLQMHAIQRLVEP